MYLPPPPISYNQNRQEGVVDYCRQCGVTEDRIWVASIGWGNREHTICRPCVKHNEIDKQIGIK